MLQRADEYFNFVWVVALDFRRRSLCLLTCVYIDVNLKLSLFYTHLMCWIWHCDSLYLHRALQRDMWSQMYHKYGFIHFQNMWVKITCGLYPKLTCDFWLSVNSAIIIRQHMEDVTLVSSIQQCLFWHHRFHEIIQTMRYYVIARTSYNYDHQFCKKRYLQ